MNIDTVLLQSFITVSETGNITRASKRIGRTQSAISQQIAKLENTLGVQLFVRGKDLVLTPDGEMFLGYARQILKLHCEVADRFQDPELEGEVRFGLPEDFASMYLSDVLANFARLHPRIVLSIECDLTVNLFKRFQEKEFDLVLVKMNCPDKFPNGQQVWQENLEWVGDAKLVKSGSSLPLVLSPQPCVYRASALGVLDQDKWKWKIMFSSTSYAVNTAAVKAGMGITVLPRNMVSKSLSIIKNSKLPVLNDINISLLKHNNFNAAVTSFERFVLKKLRYK